jgi:peroxiredoxin
MAAAHTARRAIFVLDDDREIAHGWVAEDWISPVPIEGIEPAIEALGN